MRLVDDLVRKCGDKIASLEYLRRNLAATKQQYAKEYNASDIQEAIDSVDSACEDAIRCFEAASSNLMMDFHKLKFVRVEHSLIANDVLKIEQEKK